jgi:serralysin
MATSTGTSGNDTLTGSSSDDTITPGNGNDTIDGVSGTDTVVFGSARSNYNITQTFTGYEVKDTVGSTGTKTISNVDQLQFSDKVYNLNIATDAKLLSTTQLNSLTELYVAFFNRVPEAGGFDYWIKELAGGKSMTDIAQSFYNAGVQYSSVTGFSSDMKDEDFIHVFYKNVLGRAEGADADGLSYWNSKLVDGSSTRWSLAQDILASAHTFKGDATWGQVADLLDNKVTVGTYHAVTAGIDYLTSAETLSQGVAIAAKVTATGTTEAITLIGLSDQTDYQSPPMPT